jgi:hypothetical protein
MDTALVLDTFMISGLIADHFQSTLIRKAPFCKRERFFILKVGVCVWLGTCIRVHEVANTDPEAPSSWLHLLPLCLLEGSAVSVMKRRGEEEAGKEHETKTESGWGGGGVHISHVIP